VSTAAAAYSPSVEVSEQFHVAPLRFAAAHVPSTAGQHLHARSDRPVLDAEKAISRLLEVCRRNPIPRSLSAPDRGFALHRRNRLVGRRRFDAQWLQLRTPDVVSAPRLSVLAYARRTSRGASRCGDERPRSGRLLEAARARILCMARRRHVEAAQPLSSEGHAAELCRG
jgi:hypothetical protein